MPKNQLIPETLDNWAAADELRTVVQEAANYGNQVKADLAVFMEQLEGIAYTPQTFDLDPEYPDEPVAVDMSETYNQPEAPTFDEIPDSDEVINNLTPLGVLPTPNIQDIGNFGGTKEVGDISELDPATIPTPPDSTELEELPEAVLLDVPEYSGDDIVFTNPDRPAALSEDAPDSPIIEDLPTPTAPDMDVVPAPVLESIVIPEMPEVSIPIFEGTRPTDDLTEPDLNFSFAEGDNSYVSCIKDSLPTKLCAIINGTDALALDSDITDDILATAVEQIDIEAAKSHDEILNGWALKGHELPQGAMVGRLDELRAESDRSKASVVRDIGVRQSELAIDALKHALSVGSQHEGLLMEQFNQVQTRAFEVAKIGQDAALKLFDAQIVIYNANVEMYKAEATVFEILMKGNIAIYDGYKAQMEGVKAQADVQESKVSVYVAQLSANEISAKVYEAQIRAVVAKAEIERLKIQRFGAEIDAYNARINAKTAEYSGYDSAVRAELAKAQIAESKVRGYTARIDGITQHNNVEIQKIQAVVEKNRGIAVGNSAEADSFRAAVAAVEAVNGAKALRIQTEGARNSAIATTNAALANVFSVESGAITQQNDAEMLKLQAAADQNKNIALNNNSQMDIYKSEVLALAEKNTAEAQRYGAEMAGYQESIKVALANYEGLLKKYQADMNLWDVKAQLALEEAKESVRISVQEYELSLKSAETGATVYSQLAASAMNMVNANLGMSYSGQNNNSTSLNRGAAFETFRYSETRSGELASE